MSLFLAFNVSPDPLKFVQLNSKFWDVSHGAAADDDEETRPNWMKLGYRSARLSLF